MKNWLCFLLVGLIWLQAMQVCIWFMQRHHANLASNHMCFFEIIFFSHLPSRSVKLKFIPPGMWLIGWKKGRVKSTRTSWRFTGSNAMIMELAFCLRCWKSHCRFLIQLLCHQYWLSFCNCSFTFVFHLLCFYYHEKVLASKKCVVPLPTNVAVFTSFEKINALDSIQKALVIVMMLACPSMSIL